MCTRRVMAVRQPLNALHLKRVFGIKLAAMKKQRRRIVSVVAALDLTDKNNVVALFDTASVKAFKGGRRTIEQQQAARTVGVRHATRALFTFAGKTLYQVLLIYCQNTDGRNANPLKKPPWSWLSATDSTAPAGEATAN